MTTEPATRTEWHEKELEFYVQAVEYDYWCEFTVYKVLGIESSPVPGRLLFFQKEQISTSPTIELSEAEIYLHGEVKWDGCSNWCFDEQDRVMLHFCSQEEAERIGKLFAALYDHARQVIPHWSE